MEACHKIQAASHLLKLPLPIGRSCVMVREGCRKAECNVIVDYIGSSGEPGENVVRKQEMALVGKSRPFKNSVYKLRMVSWGDGLGEKK